MFDHLVRGKLSTGGYSIQVATFAKVATQKLFESSMLQVATWGRWLLRSVATLNILISLIADKVATVAIYIGNGQVATCPFSLYARPVATPFFHPSDVLFSPKKSASGFLSRLASQGFRENRKNRAVNGSLTVLFDRAIAAFEGDPQKDKSFHPTPHIHRRWLLFRHDRKMHVATYKTSDHLTLQADFLQGGYFIGSHPESGHLSDMTSDSTEFTEGA